MNMMFRDWQTIAGLALPQPGRRRFRPAAAGAVALGHLVLAALLLIGGVTERKREPPPQPITVDILPALPKAPSLPPAPKLIAPQVPSVSPPDFAVESAPAHAITVQAPQSAAPQTASGTAPETYFGRLAAWLDARKHYPPQARRLHIQGVVRLHFVLDRSGRVLSFDIAGSSGRAILDEEAEALIQRAQPLPPIPADWPQTQLSLVVPVVFRLR